MSLVRIAIFSVLVTALALPATPSRADHYSGPPDSWTAYWAVPAFPDIKTLGPDKAKGVILWSHGVRGNEATFYAHPPDVVRRLARAGWDVIKVQRNPLFERTWPTSGPKHVTDLSERVDKALGDGYKQVIAAGGSYGGAISIETARVNTKIFAVLAFAPGHGSDAEGGSSRLYDNLTGYLVEAIAGMKTARALVLVAGEDHLHPREDRGPPVKRALDPLGIPYVLLDGRIPIKGHSALMLGQFDAWYGDCIVAFVEPTKIYTPGEVDCPTPKPVPTFLYPADMRIVKPGAELPAMLGAYSGIWHGVFEENGMEISIAVERVAPDKISFVYTTGAGPNQRFSMGAARRSAVPEQGKFVSRLENRLTVTMSLNDAGDTMNLVVVTANGRGIFPATLKRAPAL